MKIVIIGAKGQLGTDLCRVPGNFEIIPLTHSDIEITSSSSVKATLEDCKPNIIINTAAYVRVDDCETERDKAFLVNAIGARNVAVVSQQIGAKLVHMSTDYVFGGEHEERTVPYTESDIAIPANIYGESKLAGETMVKDSCSKCFIIRVSGLFGVAGSSGKGGNFIETMIKLAKKQKELKVVHDQVFSPTSTKDLAHKIMQLIATDYFGTFHITNRNVCSWFEFTCEIFKLTGLKTHVKPMTSEQYHQKARRPHYSALDNYRLRQLGMDSMQSWQGALKDYLKEKGHLA
jgi:dTDP-4-dehydrorhamnose reductase